MSPPALYGILRDDIRGGRPVALATIVVGPPDRLGAKLLVRGDGASTPAVSRRRPERVADASAGAIAAVFPIDVLLLGDDRLDRLDKAQERLFLVGDAPVLAGPVPV